MWWSNLICYVFNKFSWNWMSHTVRLVCKWVLYWVSTKCNTLWYSSISQYNNDGWNSWLFVQLIEALIAEITLVLSAMMKNDEMIHKCPLSFRSSPSGNPAVFITCWAANQWTEEKLQTQQPSVLKACSNSVSLCIFYELDTRRAHKGLLFFER